MAKSEDPDQTSRVAASDLGLHCLLRSVCPNTLDNTEGKRYLLKGIVSSIVRGAMCILFNLNNSRASTLSAKSSTVRLNRRWISNKGN